MTSVVQAGFATSVQMVRRRIQSPQFVNWRYAAVDANGNSVRQTYVLQEGEISYQQWLDQQTISN